MDTLVNFTTLKYKTCTFPLLIQEIEYFNLASRLALCWRQIMSSREKILSLLEQNKADYISGEAIATRLGLSRNAVWKAINELRKQGYIIDAISNKGYRMGSDNDIISREGIISCLASNVNPSSQDDFLLASNLDSSFQDDLLLASNLDSNSQDNLLLASNLDSSPQDSLDFTQLIHIYDSLDSTNKTAKEMVIAGADHGTLIISKKQDLGKGRKNHSFYSPNGGIYMSLILSPDRLPSCEPDFITAYTGVSVCRSIEKLCGILPSIKPINDLFIDNRKICGILTESGQEFDSGHVQWIVVGIGINFDSDISAFPQDLQSIVGSIFEPGKAPISKNQLIAEIYRRMLDWSKMDTNIIIEAYNNLLKRP